VRGASREGGSHPVGGVERVGVPDPLDREVVRAAVTGVDAIVHLAARVHVMRESASDPLAEFRRANVESTSILANEAGAAGVRQLVLASTVKAVGEGNSSAWTEDAPPAPADPYGTSKLEAERVVREAAERHGTSVAVLRFPLV
jgi:nucleoside-diphosphate-sugar epimerase